MESEEGATGLSRGSVIAGSVVMTLDDVSAGLRAMPERRGMWGLLLVALMIPLWFGLRRDGSLASALLFLALIVPVFVIAVRRAQKRSAQRLLDSLGESKKVEFEIGEHALSLRSENGNTEIKWGGIKRFVEGPDTLLVYVSPQVAQIIPKRAFAEPREVARLFSERVKSSTAPPTVLRAVVLWVVLVVALLAVWQLLAPAPSTELPAESTE